MFSQLGQSPYGNHVPLPHEDQAHFHPGGLPDLDSFGVIPPNGGLSPGERGYFCGFDTLATSGHGPSVTAENVLLVGWEGGLRVQRISRKNIDLIGRIEGLRGAVIGAKILPWTFRSDPGSSGRPYVAVIVHGPVLPEDAPGSSNTSEAMSVEDQDGGSDPSARINLGPSPEMRDVIKKYQTTVEVYSLSTRTHVATIFQTPSVEVEYNPVGEFRPPPPIGDLRIDANGKFLLVSSGVSGEIFVFSPFTRSQRIHELESIRCIGKFWTTVQRRDIKPTASVSTTGDQINNLEDADTIKGSPLLSLSHRWLAVVPPPADALFSLKGTAVLATDSSRPPGITTHVSPPRPNTNCAVDVPEQEGLLDYISREATQRGLKAAQWVGEQGMQAWNNYWKPVPTAPNTNGQYIYNPEPVSQSAFPPTHGVHTPTSSSSPTQVSIYDLQRLLDHEEIKIKNTLTPIATFEPPSGCSFLSFAPSGLVLLTVSKKGDQQFVWSLMRSQHPKSGIITDQAGPHVRLMVKFTRMTVAETIDVVWTAPQGDRFALLTDNGTMHIHEIPPSVLVWPLRRGRRSRAMAKSEGGQTEQSSTKGTVGAALNAVSGTTSWIRSAVRPKSMVNTATFSSNLMMTPAAAANVGGKAIKAGFSKSVKLIANSANTMYHAGENKIKKRNLINDVTPGSMRWMTGKDRGYLAVIATGTVNIYPVKQSSIPRKGMAPLIKAKVGKKPVEFALQKIPDDQFSPAFREAVEARFSNATKEGTNHPAISGHWLLRSPTPVVNVNPPSHPNSSNRSDNWHAHVETETNPPYQPFHTDRRVALFAYADPTTSSPKSSQASALLDSSQTGFESASQAVAAARQDWEHDVLAPWLHDVHHVDPSTADGLEHWPVDAPEPWVFGEDIPATRVFATTTSTNGDVDEGIWSDDEDAIENRVKVIEGEDGEQVVVTTVTRKGRGEEEFFEDGCEVVDFADDRV